MLFTPTYALVQRLLAAKRDLRLEKELGVLDGFDAVILDDIGYVQQSRDEMEVLFTFLAERYERKSVIITSNLVFSEWDRIFKDPMTTAAAIDRLVHHAVILEMTGTSVRAEEAEEPCRRQRRRQLRTQRQLPRSSSQTRSRMGRCNCRRWEQVIAAEAARARESKAQKAARRARPRDQSDEGDRGKKW